jgi:ferric-dicitrate binding protein FerR (iron transport regulator)
MNERFDIRKLDNDNEESLGALLREAGPRDLPSAELMEQVRGAVHAEWQSVVAQRRRRNWYVGSGIAASVAVAAVAATIGFNISTQPAPLVASVARVDGSLQMTIDGDAWQTVKVGDQLAAGALLRTDAGTRVALDFGDGVSVRMNAGSRIELKSPDRIELETGAVYIDATPQATAQAREVQALSVETLYGDVRHLGTQYEVRSVGSGIQVSVREGRIEIVNDEQHLQATSGEQLSFARGEVSRTQISPQDSHWQWATDIAPVFDIEHQSLARFLDWVARETGKRIAYATPEIRQRAEQMILRGSISNLPPTQALAAVLATTPFKHQDRGSEIQIEL